MTSLEESLTKAFSGAFKKVTPEILSRLPKSPGQSLDVADKVQIDILEITTEDITKDDFKNFIKVYKENNNRVENFSKFAKLSCLSENKVQVILLKYKIYSEKWPDVILMGFGPRKALKEIKPGLLKKKYKN